MKSLLAVGVSFFVSLLLLSFSISVSASCDVQHESDGAFLDDVTSEGYTSEFLGYKFKVDHLIEGSEGAKGVFLVIENPDGGFHNVTVDYNMVPDPLFNGDDLRVKFIQGSEYDGVALVDLVV